MDILHVDQGGQTRPSFVSHLTEQSSTVVYPYPFLRISSCRGLPGVDQRDFPFMSLFKGPVRKVASDVHHPD